MSFAVAPEPLLVVGANDVVVQDATRKTYTTTVNFPTTGRYAVGVVTLLETRNQAVDIAVGAETQQTTTPNSMSANMVRPDLNSLTYQESGKIFVIDSPGNRTVAVSVPGGSTATIFGVIVRQPDPISGIVEQQGTGENCDPKAVEMGGVRYTTHAEMYTRNVFVSAEPGPKGVLAFENPGGTGWVENDRYHTGTALYALSSGDLWIHAVGHVAPFHRCRLAVAGDLTNLSPVRTIGAGGSRFSYAQIVQLPSSKHLLIFTRGHNGDTSDRHGVLIRVSNPESIATTSPSATFDYLTSSAEFWSYSRAARLMVHPDGGREIVAWIINFRDPTNTGGGAFWDRIGVGLFDPSANGGIGHWWCLDGVSATNNTGLGTPSSPRFNNAQTTSLTGSGGMLVVNGSAANPAYFGYGYVTKVTEWPVGGGPTKGAVIFPFSRSLNAIDSNDFTPRRGFARFVRTESRRLESASLDAANFQTNEPFSISFFVQPGTATTTPDVYVARRLSEGTGRGIGIWGTTSSGSLRITVQIRSTTSPDTRIQRMTPIGALTADRWYHVAVTYDGSGTASGLRLYIDGIDLGEVSHDTLGGGTINANTPLTIGSWEGGGNPSNSRVHALRIHSRSLPPSEVLLAYNAGLPLMHSELPSALLSGLHASYDLSEQSAGTSAIPRNDSGPNGYTLTDIGNVRGETLGGVDVRVVSQYEGTRTLSPTNFEALPELQDWNSYRFACSIVQTSETSAKMLITDRNGQAGYDGIGEPRGIYFDWGGRHLLGYTVDLTDWSSPVFTLESETNVPDALSVIQIASVEDGNEFVIARGINELHQQQRQSLYHIVPVETYSGPGELPPGDVPPLSFSILIGRMNLSRQRRK